MAFFKLSETGVHEIKNHLVKRLFMDLWLEGGAKEVPRPFPQGTFLTVQAAGCGEVCNRLQQQAWAKGGGQF